jgi:peptidoglycan-associated lipoprotein
MRLSVRHCVLAFALVGCGGATAPREAAINHPSPSAPAPTPARAEEASVVNVSPEIREACGLPDTKAFFGYNSAQTASKDGQFFSKLAACFISGPLQGKGMHLVGHADPRGDADYNYLLGQRRADSVKGALVRAGLEGARVSTTSRGAQEAQGRDESTWATERRVDVVLARAG